MRTQLERGCFFQNAVSAVTSDSRACAQGKDENFERFFGKPCVVSEATI